MPRTTLFLALAAACLALPAAAQSGPEGQGGMFLGQFDAIDTDGNDSLSPAEIQAHRLARFAESDTNGDGLLSAEELSAAQAARMTERAGERSSRMLRWMDADGDGQLSAAEMSGGPSPRHLAKIDADNDGAISRAEAEAAVDRMGERRHRKGMMHD
jgi:hypothetical protein